MTITVPFRLTTGGVTAHEDVDSPGVPADEAAGNTVLVVVEPIREAGVAPRFPDQCRAAPERVHRGVGVHQCS
jgi:hypothetical protein